MLSPSSRAALQSVDFPFIWIVNETGVHETEFEKANAGPEIAHAAVQKMLLKVQLEHR